MWCYLNNKLIKINNWFEKFKQKISLPLKIIEFISRQFKLIGNFHPIIPNHIRHKLNFLIPFNQISCVYIFFVVSQINFLYSYSRKYLNEILKLNWMCLSWVLNKIQTIYQRTMKQNENWKKKKIFLGVNNIW